MGKIYKGITLPVDDGLEAGEKRIREALDKCEDKMPVRKDVNIEAPVMGLKVK